jgi:uncharacterized protein YecE (DUF72 family)
MRWLAGTSGYSYKEWKGSFYPDDCKPEQMLAYYASRLPAVEINNTFYRMPRSHVLEQWAAVVPADFRFVLKASRRITHQSRLNNVGEAVGYLARGAEVLEDKLGAVLFQLPPSMQKNLERLQGLLDVWPTSLPAAMEFRHSSWFEPEVFDLLREHGVALCVSEDGELALPDELRTADWLYLRLRQPGYTPQKLGSWIKRARATGATSAYAFFKHEDAGAGPALAARFLNLAMRPEAKRAPRKQPAASGRRRPKRAS